MRRSLLGIVIEYPEPGESIKFEVEVQPSSGSCSGNANPNEQNAQLVAEKYKLKRFIHPEELMDLCDAVDIVAPTINHFELCDMALRKGKHVFVEKPLANTMEEARTLVKLAKESNLKFQVGHVERFNPAFLALKNYDLQPMFIEVH
ncbi:MAG: Gfo/Idh/MocA family oxidoreductase, partial [Bacteroidota bacterium]